jgi:hypothetical protein
VPSGSVAFRGGVDRAIADSDLFTFVTSQLTLGRADFRAVNLVADVTARVRPRIHAVLSVGYSRSNAPSEFRDWVDNNNNPIEQTTSLTRVPLTYGVRAYLVGPGRSIGRLAWVPSRYAPYVGGAAGAMWYRFAQEGDFIDFDTTRVFADRFVSDGWTPTANVFAGTDVSLNPRFAVTGEARYQWARAGLSSDFSGFDRIDLSGLSVTVGISVRY